MEEIMLDLVKTGANIARLRKQRGWTQQELANKLIVEKQTVSKWETGKGLPDTSNLYTIAKLFGVTIEDIICEEVECGNEEVGSGDNLLDGQQLQEQVAKYAPMCIRHNILQLDEVIKLKNRQVIKALLDKYPISYVEYMYPILQQRQYGDVYRFAIDYNLERLAIYAIQGDYDNVCRELLRLFAFHYVEFRYPNIDWDSDETALADLSKLAAPTNYGQLQEIWYGNIKYVKYHINGVYIGDELIKNNEIDYHSSGAYERALKRELNILQNCRVRLMTLLNEMENHNG